ncbi:stage II sporulation protein M [Methanobacterium paludis]|uniref:Stage II sporulation protein M n=1 Tax=Methanobacterium paludis (strain DSM 25820 / JCM 18151 / SWAN1) TaxID=868131 RepID=F6D6W7_METPW|nr:stage II sporulation protein M [Methanobacterium paludis]AEG19422.1 protein of unknown function DUF95 transmembrane [Methanobacterium paludis]
MPNKLKPNKKWIKTFLHGFIPSKYAFLTFLIFYFAGFIFAYVAPHLAQSNFNGGFLLGELDAKIQVPQTITLVYLENQFIHYLGAVSWGLFVNNMRTSFLCIFSGIAIVPVVLISLFSSLGAVTYLLILKVGIFKAFLIIFGSFHLYFEVLAAMLVIDAFLKFYGSFLISIREGSTRRFKNEVIYGVLPILLSIIVLLAVAAVLEVFWSTWWVYILTHSHVSWQNFYLGLYSCIVR